MQLIYFEYFLFTNLYNTVATSNHGEEQLQQMTSIIIKLTGLIENEVSD